MCPVITLHNQLMSPGYKFKIVGVIKLFRYVLENGSHTIIQLRAELITVYQISRKDVVYQVPGQKCIQHLEEICPSHIDHLGQTIEGHT